MLSLIQMKLFYYLCITFIVAFVLQYWIISYITTEKPIFIQNTRGKMYISIFAASVMGILEVLVYDSYHNVVSLFYYIGLGLIMYLSAHFYKTQNGVDEIDYLKQMIEASSKDKLVSTTLLESTKNINVRTIATNILHRRQRDVDVMNKLLNDLAEKPALPISKKEAFAYGIIK